MGRGGGGTEVGEEGDYIVYLSLHCHRQNDSCVKIGCDESHFTVSLVVMDKVTRQRNRPEALLLTSLTPYR